MDLAVQLQRAVWLSPGARPKIDVQGGPGTS
jgi:hypothetical protein